MNVTMRWSPALPLLLGAMTALAGCSAKDVRYQSIGALPPEPDRPEVTLFLLGDGGAATEGRDAVLAHLGGEIEAAAAGGAQVVVAYLGDNIYESGAREAFAAEDRPKLAAQLEPLGRRGNVRAIFVPGNHDWARGASLAEGRAAVRRQRAWLEELADGRDVAMLPDDACPGPAALDVGQTLHLVVLDTEWLLRRPSSDGCGTPDGAYARLEADLERNRGRRVVLIAHHPLVTGGPHGGHLSVWSHVPTISYLVKKAGVERQDLSSGDYDDMIARLRAAFGGARAPLVVASGHDHNLQVIRTEVGGRPLHQLVSGSLSRSESVRRVEGTRYATGRHGYMRLDFRESGVRLVVYADADGSEAVVPVFACSLSGGRSGDECPEAPLAGGRP